METRPALNQTPTIQEETPTYSIISYPAAHLPHEYRNVILARWLRSLRNLNDYFKLIDKEAYFNVYEKFIKMILDRPTVLIKLAVLTKDRDVVLGWSVLEGTALHYVHVQEDSRKKFGICSNLIPKDIKYFTHITKHWLSIWNNKYKSAKFNPFI